MNLSALLAEYGLSGIACGHEPCSGCGYPCAPDLHEFGVKSCCPDCTHPVVAPGHFCWGYNEEATIRALCEVAKLAAEARPKDAAWALDQEDKLTRCLLDPLARMRSMNAEKASITVELTADGRPMSLDDAELLLGWVAGDDLQKALRALAASLSLLTPKEER